MLKKSKNYSEFTWQLVVSYISQVLKPNEVASLSRVLPPFPLFHIRLHLSKALALYMKKA
jgi:hypothetical protein